MSVIINTSPHNTHTNLLVKDLYEKYARKLFGYTLKHYTISEDDAWTLIYKTLYKIAEVNDSYNFETEQKRSSFLFKTHINYLRNYFRDNKAFEAKNLEVDLSEDQYTGPEEIPAMQNSQLSVLQNQLDKLEAWERILLLMRGQDMPYSQISGFVNKPENQLKVYYARLKKQLLASVNEEMEYLNNEAAGKQFQDK